MVTRCLLDNDGWAMPIRMKRSVQSHEGSQGWQVGHERFHNRNLHSANAYPERSSTDTVPVRATTAAAAATLAVPWRAPRETLIRGRGAIPAVRAIAGTAMAVIATCGDPGSAISAAAGPTAAWRTILRAAPPAGAAPRGAPTAITGATG
jgi:hypothetical protein